MFESQLRRTAQAQGVFLRREAIALGYDDRTFQRAYRAGAWVRVHHGCYTFPDIWSAADEQERYRITSRAILRTHNEEVALSHASSLLERDVHYWGLDLSHTHLTRTAATSGRVTGKVQHHRGTLPEEDVEVVNGVPVTVMPRAVLETAFVNPLEAGLVSTDSALHKKLVTIAQLEQRYAQMRDWPGAHRGDLLLRLADGRAESAGESRARFMMWSQALPMPDLQYDIRESSSRLLGTTDFAWPEHGLLGEFDGKVKYGRLLRPGEDPTDAVIREKKREDRITEVTGWRMIRLDWSDLYRPEETAARIRRLLRRAA